MSRPLKLRKVCMLPKSSVFSPVGQKRKKNPIFLTIDEYEVIRLLDKEGFSQEQCGEYMEIARTTVQQIYASARKKIAEAYAASHKEVKRNLAGTGVLNHAGSDSFRDSLPIFKGMRICPT